MQALGQHVIGDFFGCDRHLLDDAPYLERALLGVARDLGATAINATFHHFSPIGVSGVVVIQESHLAIHTWPEGGYAAVDLFTCGDHIDPQAAIPALQEVLRAGRAQQRLLPRGRLDELPPLPPLDAASTNSVPPLRLTRDHWFTARHEHLALSLKLIGSRLHWQDSTRQRIEVYESAAYGRFLALDGRIVISERDERGYHELLVHTVAQVQTRLRRAVVLGGGDGGAVRELLRYPNLQEIVVVEWDERLPAVVQRFFPSLGRGLRDPRVSWVTAEAQQWLPRTAAAWADVVVVDLPGEWGQWAEVQRNTWLAGLTRILAPHGCVVMAGPSPRQEKQAFRGWWQAWNNHFVDSDLALLHLPTYPGGQMSLMLGAQQAMDFQQVGALPTWAADCQVYNEALHRAAFALPNDIRRMLATQAAS